MQSMDTLLPLFFAGFASVNPELTVEEMLVDMRYRQPHGRESATTAIHVSAGVQPTGRAMP